jgi:hypothetical protein
VAQPVTALTHRVTLSGHGQAPPYRVFKPGEQRYIVEPGEVISDRDGQRHWVSANELIQLYAVDRSECIIEDNMRFTNEALGNERVYGEGMVRLRPQNSGYYRLLCAHCAADRGIEPANAMEELEHDFCMSEGGHFWFPEDHGYDVTLNINGQFAAGGTPMLSNPNHNMGFANYRTAAQQKAMFKAQYAIAQPTYKVGSILKGVI